MYKIYPPMPKTLQHNPTQQADLIVSIGAEGERTQEQQRAQAEKRVTSHPGKAKKWVAVTLTNKYHATELGVEDQPVPRLSSHIPLGAETGQDSSPNSNS